MKAVRWSKTVGVMAAMLLVVLATAQGAGDSLAMQIAQPDGPVTDPAVSLQITMTNTASRELTLVKSNPGCDFTAMVKDPDGHDAEFTEAGRELSQCRHRMLLGRRIIVTLRSGESTEDVYPLSWYYDLKRPGSYSVKLQREVPQGGGGGMVSSNEVTVVLAK